MSGMLASHGNLPSTSVKLVPIQGALHAFVHLLEHTNWAVSS